MTRRLSKRRLIENEKLLRDNNESAKEAIKKYFAHGGEAHIQPINFYCECSDAGCAQLLSMSIEDYESAHQRNDRFTVVPGHELGPIEKVVATHESYVIVEKYEVPAAKVLDR